MHLHTYVIFSEMLLSWFLKVSKIIVKELGDHPKVFIWDGKGNCSSSSNGGDYIKLLLVVTCNITTK